MRRYISPVWSRDHSRSSSSIPEYLMVLALVLVGWCAVSCSGATDSGGIADDLCVLSAAEYLEDAIQGAKDWTDDAYLTYVSGGPSSLALDDHCSYANLTYSFDSPSKPREFYMTFLWRREWTSETHHHSHMAVIGLPIEREDWALDSVDAWRIAQNHGGREFVNRHVGSDTDIFFQLDRFEVGGIQDVLVWRVAYSVRPHIPGGHLDIRIDPRTGDILEVEAK